MLLEKRSVFDRVFLKIICMFLVFLMVFMPFSKFKKVRAEAIPSRAGAIAVIAILLTALSTQGLVNNNYNLSSDELSKILGKIQTKLSEAGEGAIDGFNKFGEAVANGYESYKIKALAKGTYVFIVLDSIREVLFPKTIAGDSHDITLSEGQYGKGEYVSSRYLSDIDITVDTYLSKQFVDTVKSYDFSKTLRASFKVNEVTTSKVPSDYGLYYGNQSVVGQSGVTYVHLDSIFIFTLKNGPNAIQPVPYDTFIKYLTYIAGGVYLDANGKLLYMNCNGSSWGSTYNWFVALKALGFDIPVHNIKNVSNTGILTIPDFNLYKNDIKDYGLDGSQITVPTELPSDMRDSINNWDGTSNLVLSPGADVSIPEEKQMDIDIGYDGADVIDPDIPDTPEETTPAWIAGLLAGIASVGQHVKSGIDSVIDGISSHTRDLIDGVRDITDSAIDTVTGAIDGVKVKAGEIAGSIADVVNPAITGIRTGVDTMVGQIEHFFDPPDKDIDWDKLKSSGSVIFTKFPFSIPADLRFLVGLLVSDPQAPKWKVNVPFSIAGDWAQDGEFELDFSVIDGFMVIVRNIELLAFIFSMVYMTRQLIWK